ncbi:carbonic anhydrase [Flavobacterium luteum]|uniref:Carbonic anhydrase n=1 Tax=Flavobacterium luteum TaxID=2026654 RepID=A0A7J5AJC5_9FLAO|nr:carbonic anhydrase [Flavobacterium luteum]KAB1157645.1 carbonic anhydrase [Flavobacterium luteum]
MKKITLVFTVLLSITFSTFQAQVTAESSLQLLKEGNKRFVEGKSIRPHQNLERVKEVSLGQKPFAIIVGCSDSRVPSEIIFDQGLGDLFIVRTAGQVSSFASWGSIEFANAVLGAKLIVVMGHTKCGAVAAACKVPDVPGHIVTLINAIKPAAQLAKTHDGDQIENAVKINVAMQVQQLQNMEPVLTKAVVSGDTKIVGAVYDLASGKVEFLEPDFLNTFQKK